uniref:Uncharacterized protein n=1 Tax=Vespula pensylvanica TaxID=30213 RepID=A0A834P0B0_VESPE|nr:hypothetical protein H0235_008562 [Vespula pensylvanica]
MENDSQRAVPVQWADLRVFYVALDETIVERVPYDRPLLEGAESVEDAEEGLLPVDNSESVAPGRILTTCSDAVAASLCLVEKSHWEEDQMLTNSENENGKEVEYG